MDPETPYQTYSDTGLAGEGEIRYYHIQALGVNEDSAFSDAVIGQSMLARPTGVDAEAISGHEIDVTWTDNSELETGYSIEQRFGEDDWQEVAWADGNGESTGSPGGHEPIMEVWVM